MLCVSCLEESIDPNDETFNSDYYRICKVDVGNVEPGADTKTILTVEPQEIKNLHVFAFDPNTKSILIYDDRAGSELSGKPIEKYVENTSSINWCLPTNTAMDIYAVANIGKLDVPATIDALKENNKVKLTFNSLQEINSLQTVPMSGLAEGISDTGTNGTIYIYLKSILARFDIQIAFKDEAINDQVIKVSVANANKSTSLFSTTNAAKSKSDLITGMDQTTELDIVNLNQNNKITLYTLENLQTTVNGATSTASSWKDVTSSGQNLDYCTKLLISTEQPNGKRNVTVLYLGQNATTNFDVIRNIKKTLTIRLGEIDKFLYFTDISFQVKENNEAIINFKYSEELPTSFLVASNFKSNNANLTIKTVTYDESSNTGTVTVKAGSVSEDTDVTLTFSTQDDNYIEQQYIGGKIVNAPNVTKVFFDKENNIEYGSNAFVPIRVYAEYDDGSIEDVTHSPFLSFSTTKSGYAKVTTTQGTLPLEGESLIVNWGLVDGFDMNGNQVLVKGIKFGNPGTATLTAQYMDINGQLKNGQLIVRCVKDAVILTPSRYKVWLDYNSTQTVRFTYSTNANVQLQGWKAPRAIEYSDMGQVAYNYKHCVQASLPTNKPTTTAEIKYSTSNTSLYDNYEPYLALKSGSVTENFTIDIYYERAQTNALGGYVRDYVTSIDVVVTNGGENGTFQSLDIIGPDKVIYGDDAKYKAIATYVSSAGETYTKDVTTNGSWECQKFKSQGNQKKLGEFYTAEGRNVTTSVNFTFGGVKYTKNVLMYMYSKLAYEIDNSSVKTFVKPKRDNPFEKSKLYASVVDIKLKEQFYGKDDKLVETKDKNFAFSPELAKNSTLKICGLVYHNNVAFPYATKEGKNSVEQVIWVWMGDSYNKDGFKYASYDTEYLRLTLPFYEIKSVSADEFGKKIGLFYGDDTWEEVTPAMWPFSFPNN